MMMTPSRRAALLAALMIASGAAAAAEVGALLRQGRWHGEMQDFDPPAAFGKRARSAWPADGWVALNIGKTSIAATAEPGPRPAFLQAITDPRAKPAAPSKALYLRTPRIALKTGTLPLLAFKDGKTSPVLRPGRRIETMYEGQAFGLTLQLKALPPNEEGETHEALLRLDYAGKQVEYDLGNTTPAALAVTLRAAAALDTDAVPDLIVEVATGSQIYEAVLLSSVAVAGRNDLSASLQHVFD